LCKYTKEIVQSDEIWISFVSECVDISLPKNQPRPDTSWKIYYRENTPRWEECWRNLATYLGHFLGEIKPTDIDSSITPEKVEEWKHECEVFQMSHARFVELLTTLELNMTSTCLVGLDREDWRTRLANARRYFDFGQLLYELQDKYDRGNPDIDVWVEQLNDFLLKELAE